MTLREFCQEILTEKAYDYGLVPDMDEAVRKWVEEEAEQLGVHLISAMNGWMNESMTEPPGVED